MGRCTTLWSYVLELANLVPNAVRRAHPAVGWHDARSSELQRRSTLIPECLLVPSNDFSPVPDSLGSPRERQTGGVRSRHRRAVVEVARGTGAGLVRCLSSLSSWLCIILELVFLGHVAIDELHFEPSPFYHCCRRRSIACSK